MRPFVRITGTAGMITMLTATAILAGKPAGVPERTPAGGPGTGAAALARSAADTPGATYLETDPDHPRIQYADGLVSINDHCPPCGRKISPGMRPVYVNGQPVGFCCRPCPPDFMEAPGGQLSDLGIRIRCIMNPAADAVLDDAHGSIVNREVFFFSTTDLKARFDQAPHRYCGALTDPVSGERFRPTEASPRVEYDVRPYYFASEKTWRAFADEPGRHAAMVVEKEAPTPPAVASPTSF